MIRDTYTNIIENKEVRQNLIKLKSEIKEGFNKSALLYQIGTDYTLFEQLLEHEDPKVRKNIALIIGELALPGFLEKLFAAYLKEEQLFVKSSYLTAVKKFNYSSLLSELKKRIDFLSSIQVDVNNKKHVNEEIRALSDLILDAEGTKHHEFIGFNIHSELVLLTNRNYKNITLEQLKTHRAKEFNAGILVKTNNLNEILPIRTYDELLFMLEDLKSCDYNVDDAATLITKSSLMKFLSMRHKGDVPFYFRIELKSKLALDKKSAFTKKLGSEIERLSERKLINTTSNYEFELRLIENKEGNLNVLIKLYTLKDERFLYRINSIATSITPVNAALMTSLSKEYMTEDAQILDPFCGVGTMLIERHKLIQAGTMYGLDIYSSAIDKAKENMKQAHTHINLINRDFFDFKHEYLFDEIITNMPRVLGHKEEQDILKLYQMFFLKAPEHLNQGGVMILYSHNKEYIKKFANKEWYQIKQEFEISKKEGAYLYVIQYRGR